MATIGEFIRDIVRLKHGMRLTGPVLSGQATPEAIFVTSRFLMGYLFTSNITLYTTHIDVCNII